ncbi:MAG: hypothetical protein NCW75_11725 [Phycisphaera sp.]|nr:MAG: hypothetical protein NCW75_11725 [Phycisphaera sp.]
MFISTLSKVMLCGGLTLAFTCCLAACNPYASGIGTSTSFVDEYRQTQTDEVPIILGAATTHGIRGMKLVREKADGDVPEHSIHVSVLSSSSTPLNSLRLDGSVETITLSGTSTLADVDARSYGVIYNTFAFFPITPQQIRKLDSYDDLLIVVAGVIEFGPIELGPKGRSAIRTYIENFVDKDGIGDNVIRSKTRRTN